MYGQEHHLQAPYHYGEQHNIHNDPSIPQWGGRRARTPRYLVLEDEQDQGEGEEAPLDYYHDSRSNEEGQFQAHTSMDRKGKGAASMVHSSDEQASDSGDDHSGLDDFGERLQLHGDSGAHSSSSEGEDGNIRLSIQKQQDKNRALFEREWKRLRLGPPMTALEVAERVALIRLPGISNVARGMLAANIIAKYKDDEYLHLFKIHSGRISKKAYTYRVTLKNQGITNEEELDIVSVQMAVAHFQAGPEAEAGSKSASGSKLRKFKPNKTELDRKAAAENRIDQVGDLILQTLALNNMDIDQMSLYQLDDVVRQIDIGSRHQKGFTDTYLRWLERRRNVPKREMDLLRDYRKRYRDDLKNERKRRMRKERIESSSTP